MILVPLLDFARPSNHKRGAFTANLKNTVNSEKSAKYQLWHIMC
jgi:hypothetical protein